MWVLNMVYYPFPLGQPMYAESFREKDRLHNHSQTTFNDNTYDINGNNKQQVTLDCDWSGRQFRLKRNPWLVCTKLTRPASPEYRKHCLWWWWWWVFEKVVQARERERMGDS